MTMSPRTRKAALTAHVISSVGWLGAVFAFLALAVVGSTSQDDQLVRAALLVMRPITWFVLVPLAFASLLTGLVSALGTTWGLFQHYWVLFKLLLNLIATVVLLVYTQTVDFVADTAAEGTLSGENLRALAGSPQLHAALALLVLLVSTVLAVYKPRGLTSYGRRKQDEQRRRAKRVTSTQ
ncbi:Predicted integral membrane protein [Amycolatopsis marina]|uniref:Predicted integral membrane protein n=1 Tax=Amycolatopsis marina TaxID=490629 RepID=A0A1I1C223_9PSEU|nr:DUF2269 family protein [Amycolatopsis marina]SFB56724.1 Predicted integral membrane protein [Amycolatopsis marina]